MLEEEKLDELDIALLRQMERGYPTRKSRHF